MNPKAKIIVAGNIIVAEGKRDEFIERSKSAVQQARAKQNCIDFSVSTDPIETNRVNIFEAWASKDALHQFRGEGPDDGLSDLIEGAEITEYSVSIS